MNLTRCQGFSLRKAFTRCLWPHGGLSQAGSLPCRIGVRAGPEPTKSSVTSRYEYTPTACADHEGSFRADGL